MKIGTLNLFLGSLLFVAVFLHLVVRPDPARRNFEIMPDMAESIPFDAQGANENFPDGQNLRSPVPGTIARGFLPLHYAATPEDALRAGEELTNPFATGDETALARGEFVYETFCRVCHGPEGAGNGVLTTRGVPPPPSLKAEHALAMKDGQMFHVLTRGQNNMPPYASQVDRDDRWRAILYVRSLQEKKP
jgi:mono/diheme cytochrome c family protein